MNVLYEDNHLIIVNKNPGEIVQADKSGDLPLSHFVKMYITEKYRKTGAAFLGTIHRIDRPVSGIVVFARTSKALERMNKMFAEKSIRKTYWAVVKQRPPKDEDTLIHYLLKNEAQNKSYGYTQEQPKSLKCELSYRVLAAADNYFLLEVNPVTGRHHQIRVQLSAIGCPIKGDLKYGFNRNNPDASIHLHAREIKFIHPVRNEPVHIVANTPDEPLWNYFSGVINTHSQTSNESANDENKIISR